MPLGQICGPLVDMALPIVLLLAPFLKVPSPHSWAGSRQNAHRVSKGQATWASRDGGADGSRAGGGSNRLATPVLSKGTGSQPHAALLAGRVAGAGALLFLKEKSKN